MVVGDFGDFLVIFGVFFGIFGTFQLLLLVFFIICDVLLVLDIHFGWLVGIAGGIGWNFDDFL